MPEKPQQPTLAQSNAKLRAEKKQLEESIKERKRYYDEQEKAIQDMIDTGNNRLRELVFEEREYQEHMQMAKEELIEVNERLTNKRLELAGLTSL